MTMHAPRSRVRAAFPVLAALAVLAPRSSDGADLGLEFLGRYTTGIFDNGGAEIVSYDVENQRVLFVNADANQVVALDITDPSTPTLAYSIDVAATAGGGGANSVDVHGGLIAVAVEAPVKQDPGLIAIYDANDGSFLASFPAGALPDMVTFTPDGTKILAANEGEPSDDYTVDPEGTVTMIDLSNGLGAAVVTQIDLRLAFPEVLDGAVRVFGPGASALQDMEPEYIAVSSDSRTAWVTLQENNAFARFDLERGMVTDIQPLGYKDHSLPGQGLDASDRDGTINIANWPVFGMYLPDALAAFEVGGETYLVSANEGDARDYDGFSEESRVKDLTLDPAAFPNGATLRTDANIGRLNVTTTLGNPDGDDDYDALYAFGARSITIWNADGDRVWDSGEELEQITAAAFPTDFNSDNAENDSFDSRSDNKGPEPEGVTIGEIGGRTYAFVCLERIGGVAVYDVTDPHAPVFVVYENSRDFAGDAEAGSAGDLGPEASAFIPAAVSPTGADLLAVGNEVSGSVAFFAITDGHGDPAGLDDSIAPSHGLTFASANPFADSVTLRFELASDGVADLAVFDATGRQVRSLASGLHLAGVHELTWDGRDGQGREAASGVYYARFETNSSLTVRRLVLTH